MSTIVDDLDARLGTRIKIERERRGWSLTDLSARSGVSRAMINKVERGEASPTASLLGRLSGAYAFARQLVWVLGGTLTFIEGDVAHTLAAGDCLELGPPSDCTFRNERG